LLFRAKSRNLLLLSVLQNVDIKIEPTWVQPIDERNLLCARPFFQL
jgi:hypothetical protein